MDPYVRFVVEKVDVDGDKIPDGDLVKRYEWNRKTRVWELKGQKFVAEVKMKAIASAVPQTQAQGRMQVVYQAPPEMPPPEPRRVNPQPVAIQEETRFGQYVKAGAGDALGRGAVNLLFAGLLSLFSNNGGARRSTHRPAAPR